MPKKNQNQNDIGPKKFSAEESLNDIISGDEKSVDEIFFSSIPEEKPKRKYTPRKAKTPVPENIPIASPIITFSGDDFRGVFSAVSNTLKTRYPKWELSDSEITELSNAFAPLASKYGANFVQWLPEIMFAMAALNVVMRRI